MHNVIKSSKVIILLKLTICQHHVKKQTLCTMLILNIDKICVLSHKGSHESMLTDMEM
jgi:hypothetical protein